jgi:hypothetical protein
MLSDWRDRLPDDSLFKKPLVLEIVIVLCIKLVLLFLLWWFAFKPLKSPHLPNIQQQLGLTSTLVKEANHE